VKPPRAVYEAIFEDLPPLIFKAELTVPEQPHDIALEGWALEQAAHAGVSVPRVLAQDSSENDVPFCYLVMSKLEGAALEDASLTAAQRQTVLVEAAEHLVRLHSVETRGYGWLDESVYLETGSVRGAAEDWHSYTAEAGHETLRQLSDRVILTTAAASRLGDRLWSIDVPRQPEGRLMNGDFDASQIFVRNHGGFSGFIDFGDRESGPREWEFATVHLWDEPLLDALLSAYETALGRRLDREVVPVYCIAKLLQIIQRRLDRGDIEDARLKASDLGRFL
jgi:aminoglycoside phosphotransferase (APT) family kinase protein